MSVPEPALAREPLPTGLLMMPPKVSVFPWVSTVNSTPSESTIGLAGVSASAPAKSEERPETVRAPEPSAPVWPIFSVPAVRAIPFAIVFGAERARVPGPVLVRVPVPLRTPVMARVSADLLTSTAVLLRSETGAAMGWLPLRTVICEAELPLSSRRVPEVPWLIVYALALLNCNVPTFLSPSRVTVAGAVMEVRKLAPSLRALGMPLVQFGELFQLPPPAEFQFDSVEVAVMRRSM